MFGACFVEHGTRSQLTAPETLHQNGISERNKLPSFLCLFKLLLNPHGLGRLRKDNIYNPRRSILLKMMPAVLKNVGETYQKLDNKVFSGLIGKALKA